MKLHDTHAHLDMLLSKLDLFDSTSKDIDLDNPDLSLDYSFDKKKLENLLKDHDLIIQSTVSTDNFLLAKQLFSEIKNVYFTIGSHPEIVASDNFCLKKYLEKQEEKIEKYLKSKIENKIIGIGEVGLDYYWAKEQEIRKTQRKLFQNQIELAIKNNLPLVVHSRDSWEDTLEMIQDNPKIHNNFIIHCFTGSQNEANKILQMGGTLGIGGVVTYKNAKDLQEAVQNTPITNIIIETDLPFLPPTPYRGKTCLPNYIQNTASYIADLKEISVQKVLEQSMANTQKLFFNR